MNITEIMKIIPHRYPFLLVDKVEYIDDEKIVAIKNVTINEGFFQGHYPNEPIMPGVLIIESLAQAGAIAILNKEEFKGKTPYFGGINKAKFRKKVVPGDIIRLEVELIKLKSMAGLAKGVAYVNNTAAAEAELTFILG